MPDYYNEQEYNPVYREKKKSKNKIWLNILLFIITLLTTTIAGMEWTTGVGGPYELSNLVVGLPYSLSVLFILGCHEFGHYFAARYHKVKATLPYFIPMPSFSGLFLNFGTMGAVIKTKTPVPDNRSMFDIGAAGPIAGFIACVLVLVYGFTHLPPVEYLLNIHPDYFSPSYNTQNISLSFGDNLLFVVLKNLLVNTDTQFVPPMSEIYHYPYLCVGWFGLFVTAMNLIPVGQLDGGHIVFSMFGEKKHYLIARVSLYLLFVLGVLGSIDSFMNTSYGYGWSGWLFWAVILIFVIKVKHPPVYNFYELDNRRIYLGYFCMFILVVSFTPSPFIISINQ